MKQFLIPQLFQTSIKLKRLISLQHNLINQSWGNSFKAACIKKREKIKARITDFCQSGLMP